MSGVGSEFRGLGIVEAPKSKRFTEPAKFLPILFVCGTIAVLYFIFVFCHCLPLVGAAHHFGLPEYSEPPRPNQWPWATDPVSAWRRGVLELIVFHIITALLLVCYVLSILVHPGEIPDNDPEWAYTPGDLRTSLERAAAMNLQETKKSGERRHCKWCGKFKPDRCHHCRVCRICILKMDHHCPWIYNCVGFKNYKCFFLLLCYTVLDLNLIVWSMIETVIRCWDDDMPFMYMFGVLFGETLSIFLGVLVTLFWVFHIWLMSKAMTTIEFCEKKMPKGSDSRDGWLGTFAQTDPSVYDLGFYGNVKAILGPNIWCWCLPHTPPVGDGLNFVSPETRLTKDLEAAKGIRRKTHQKMQRIPQHGRGSSSYHSDIIAGY